MKEYRKVLVVCVLATILTCLISNTYGIALSSFVNQQTKTTCPNCVEGISVADYLCI